MVYDPRNPNPNQVPYMQQQQGPYMQPGMPVTGYVQPPPAKQIQPIQQPAQQPVLPPVYGIDEQFVAQAYSRHKTDMLWGGGPQYITFPGPQGQKRWDSSVFSGYECTVNVYLAPPWAEGVGIFYPVRSHFWKSATKPQGQSIACSGPDVCLICKARELALSQTDEMVRQRAKDAGRVSTRFLYNCFLLDNWQAHYDATGTMRPFILQAGSMLHSAIGDIIEARGGAMVIVHPMHGKPLRLKKKKTGNRELDVEYSLVDLDARPLPTEFYPALSNLWNLADQDRQPTQADMLNAIADIGLPMAAGPGRQPQPAYNNPYTLTMPQQNVLPQPIPAQYQGVPVNQYSVPIPPAVRSTATQTPYNPQPSQPIPMAGQPIQGVSMAPQTYSITNPPPPPDLTAPPQVQAQGRIDGRDRCFGKFAAESNFCGECPPDLKPKCMVASLHAEAPNKNTVEMLQAQLQAELQGK